MSKTVIVITDGESHGYRDQEKAKKNNTKVVVTPVGEDGAEIRGYGADVVLIPSDVEVSDYAMVNVIEPMIATTDGRIIEY